MSPLQMLPFGRRLLPALALLLLLLPATAFAQTPADTTPPTTEFLGTDPPVSPDGWSNYWGDLFWVYWSCIDEEGGSGEVMNPVVSFAIYDQVEEGQPITLSAVCSDNDGNYVYTSPFTFRFDISPPNVTVPADVTVPATGPDGAVVTYPPCTAEDSLSGLAAPIVHSHSSGSLFPIGTTGVYCGAWDKAGNHGYSYFFVNVLPVAGFYQPVDMNGVYNTVKGGSTVPLKFELFQGPTEESGLFELTSTSAVQSFTQQQIACPDAASATTYDEVELTTSGGTSLRYDATTGQFVQNWQTPRAKNTCYKVTMTAQNGTSLEAYFKLK